MLRKVFKIIRLIPNIPFILFFAIFMVYKMYNEIGLTELSLIDYDDTETREKLTIIFELFQLGPFCNIVAILFYSVFFFWLFG